LILFIYGLIGAVEHTSHKEEADILILCRNIKQFDHDGNCIRPYKIFNI